LLRGERGVFCLKYFRPGAHPIPASGHLAEKCYSSMGMSIGIDVPEAIPGGCGLDTMDW
jgi:hypothetical protein